MNKLTLKDIPIGASSVLFKKPVGKLMLFEGVTLIVTQKPNWFHLFMMRILFGWKYEGYKGSDL